MRATGRVDGEKSATMPELYHWEPNGPFLKPLVALHEKTAEFTSRYFDAANLEQLAADFPRSTESELELEHEGPVLVDRHEVICGSFFMLEYVAESLPGPELCPRDAYGRYRVRAWGQLVAQRLAPAVTALGCATYLSPALAERDRAPLEADIARLEPVERRAAWEAVLRGVYDNATLGVMRDRLRMPVHRIEAALAQTDWLAGPEYSIADIDAYAMLAPAAHLAPAIVNAELTPCIAAFIDSIAARPAVQRALAASRTGVPQTAFVPGPEPSRWG